MMRGKRSPVRRMSPGWSSSPRDEDGVSGGDVLCEVALRMREHHVLIGKRDALVKDNEAAARPEELQCKVSDGGECDAVFHDDHVPFL